jgi:hypothetical protein
MDATPSGSNEWLGASIPWAALRLPTAILGQPYRLNPFAAPQGHAAIAVAIGPAGIATGSGWGLAVMTLLVLRAGTIILRRAKRRP